MCHGFFGLEIREGEEGNICASKERKSKQSVDLNVSRNVR